MAVVSTGVFDGVHLGHRTVIETLLETASKRGERSLIVTFDANPKSVLQEGPSSRADLLTDPVEKELLLKASGVDRVETLPFTDRFAALSAGEYLSMLKREFGASAIVTGYDNHIGSDLLCGDELAKAAAQAGIEAVQVKEAVIENGEPVSSSRIRGALAEGGVEDAAEMLGYRYCVSGTVVKGKQMGRTINFPTANLRPSFAGKMLPKAGVYASDTLVGDEVFRSMTNIDASGLIETHLFDFDRDIYGEYITVTFKAFVRNEMHFDNFNQLKQRLLEDEKICIFV